MLLGVAVGPAREREAPRARLRGIGGGVLGNALATIVMAKLEGALDTRTLEAELHRETVA